MKSNRLVFPAASILALLLAACGSATAEPTELPAPQVETVQSTATPEPVEPIEFVDGLGRSVTLQGPAQRIVSLAPTNTELLFAIGAGDLLVGRDNSSTYPEEAQSVTEIGDPFVSLDTEQIVGLQPDLILASELNPPDYITDLEALGLNVYWLASPTVLDDLYTNLDVVGQLTGRQGEAQSAISDLQARVAAVEDALGSAAETPTVFYELDASDTNAPITAGFGTFIDELISRAGGANIASDLLDADYGQLDLATLLQQDPDIILLGDSIGGVTPEMVAQRSDWQALSAVQNNRIYTFDANLTINPGPRLVDALEELARIFHPDLFP